MSSPPLAGLTYSQVGAGRLGESLGRWLSIGGARLIAVARSSTEAPPPAWAPVGVTVTPVCQLSSVGQDLLLLVVPDDELAGVVARLAERPQARVALHTSGARGAEILAPLAARGTSVGTLHPLRAFPRPAPAPEAAQGTFWAVDGDPAARELAERLIRVWRGKHGRVDASRRPLYHLAATLAAGGAVTLLAAALELAESLGLAEQASGGLLELAKGSLEQSAGPEAPLEAVSPGGSRRQAAGAITGPAARGDRSYLEQLSALRHFQPELHPLAVLLALQTLRQRSLEVPLSPRQLELEQDLKALCAAPGFLDPVSS